MLLSQVVPGMYTSNDQGNGIGYSYFSIRGFGQARTRVMLNGAPLNDAESGELFFIDLADFLATSGDVQVQRGVFGLSGLGGAVDITTALPSVTPAFSVHAGVGSYGTTTADGEVRLRAGRRALGAVGALLEDEHRRLPRPVVGGLVELLPRARAVRRAFAAARHAVRRARADAPGLRRRAAGGARRAG